MLGISVDDILKAGSLRVGEATLLEGGFPCQGFSTARGRRDVNFKIKLMSNQNNNEEWKEEIKK